MSEPKPPVDPRRLRRPPQARPPHPAVGGATTVARRPEPGRQGPPPSRRPLRGAFGSLDRGGPRRPAASPGNRSTKESETLPSTTSPRWPGSRRSCCTATAKASRRASWAPPTGCSPSSTTCPARSRSTSPATRTAAPRNPATAAASTAASAATSTTTPSPKRNPGRPRSRVPPRLRSSSTSTRARSAWPSPPTTPPSTSISAPARWSNRGGSIRGSPRPCATARLRRTRIPPRPSPTCAAPSGSTAIPRPSAAPWRSGSRTRRTRTSTTTTSTSTASSG